MKLCKDCKWSKRLWFWWITGSKENRKFFFYCVHPRMRNTSLKRNQVDGNPIEKAMSVQKCLSEREFTDRPCGPDGKLWEKR